MRIIVHPEKESGDAKHGGHSQCVPGRRDGAPAHGWLPAKLALAQPKTTATQSPERPPSARALEQAPINIDAVLSLDESVSVPEITRAVRYNAGEDLMLHAWLLSDVPKVRKIALVGLLSREEDLTQHYISHLQRISEQRDERSVEVKEVSRDRRERLRELLNEDQRKR